MITTIHPIPAFSDNYIWTVISSTDNRACVVDPGDAEPVLTYLQENGLTLSDILITHHHPDHTGGLAQLVERYSPRVIGPKPSNIKGISHYVAEGDEIELFGHVFSVLEVPGHTLDHIAFYSNGDDTNKPILFCGDTLFAAGCGRLFEGTPPVMSKSLAKLAALPEATLVYCTHEYTLANLRFAVAADPDNERIVNRIAKVKTQRKNNKPTLPSSIKLELETNPFLRCNQPALIKSAELQLQHPANNAVEVFAALRSWKDSF